MVYSSWDIVCDRLKLAILGHFLPFYPPPPLKTKKSKFWKNEKHAGDIIILPTCTKNHNHMRYASWDTEWDWQNFWSLWAIFGAFTQFLNQKIKILKKCKKHMDISSFYWCIPKIPIIWCMLPEIWSVTDSWDMACDFYTCTP